MQTRTTTLVLMAVAALVAAVGRASGQPATDEGDRSLVIAAQTWPEDIIPGRARLEDPVTVDTTGTVVGAVSRIAAAAGRDWLLGVAPDSELAGAPFSVTDETAWVALDRLREAFGYDWGFVEGTIVCWPALLPQRERETPAAAPAEKREPEQPGEALSFPQPNELDAVLELANEAGVLRSGYVAPHPELAPWRVAGSLSQPDGVRFMCALAAAIGMTTDSLGPFGRLVVNSHRRLDAAIRFLDEHPAVAGLQGERLAQTLADAVPPLLCAQQWTIMRSNRGLAELAFRELPVEVAAVVVARVREKAKEEGAAFEPDWAQAQRMKVTVRHITGSSRTPDGWVSVSDLKIGIEVPAKDGSVVSF